MSRTYWRFGLFDGRIASPLDLLVLAGGAVFVLVLLVFVFALIIGRSRRRERLMTEAVRAGQPELALYVVQGPRRFFAGLLLVASLLVMAVSIIDSPHELAIPSAIVAAVCAVVLFKRPRMKAGGQPLPPPPPGSSQRSGSIPQPPPAAPGPPPTAPLPAPAASNGVFETALAVAMAILVVFAGLVLLRMISVPLLVIGVGVLVYFAVSHERRAKCLRYLGRQAGRLRDWLDGKAGQE